MHCCVAFVLALLLTSAAQAQEFPYDRDLVLDARPMRGGKRVPVLSIDARGQAQIDLWCKRGQGQAVIAGGTITIIVRSMADEAVYAGARASRRADDPRTLAGDDLEPARRCRDLQRWRAAALPHGVALMDPKEKGPRDAAPSFFLCAEGEP